MICKQCYLQPGCHRKTDPDGRCDFYVKKSAVKLGEDSDVNPMDTIEFEYSDLKQLLGEFNKKPGQNGNRKVKP
ncbi:MAG TPA: hypothetical protein ACFCUC_05040 [Desulfobacterales bacterium]